MRFHLLILTVALALAAPALAQDNDARWPVCANEGGQRPIPDRIAACTTIIGSGRENQADLAMAHSNRGNAYVEQRDYPRAIADYDEAIRLKPHEAIVHYNRGHAYGSIGARFDPSRAIADYSEAIRLDPQFAEAYGNRAWIKEQTGQSEGALADYSELLRLRPDAQPGREGICRILTATSPGSAETRAACTNATPAR